jgi:hypothetical protein
MSKQPEIGTKHPSFDAPKLKLKPLSTLIVAIAVTIGGLARVDVAPTMTGADAAPFAITHSPTNRAA